MSLFEELKRRNVFRVGIAYAVGGWLVLQLAEVLSELLNLPEEMGPIVVAIVAIGFPIALFSAWAFELTPEGVKREEDVDRSQSVTSQTGSKLNRMTLVLLAVALGYFIWEARFKDDAPGGSTEAISSTGVESPAASEPAINPSSIAVLPFANRSNRDDDLFFTDGIHDDLLTQLAKIDDLKVISRTSVMEYRDTTKKIPEIAGELSVGTILEGGVQRAGNRIRINAQLIDVATDEHLWAETFDREMTIDNIFEIQSEITAQIVTAVRGNLTANEQRVINERPTTSLAAWEAYLHTGAILSEPDYGAEKYRRAEEWARKAVAEDPDFGDAWARLARIYMQSIWIGYGNTPERRAEARDALDKAITLAPDSAAVLATQAEHQYRIELNYPRALALYQQALAITPGNATFLQDIGTTLRRMGRWDESIAAFENSLTLDPLNAETASTMIESLLMMNQWERVRTESERWLAREPESLDLLMYKVDAMVAIDGDLQGAEAFLETTRTTMGIRLDQTLAGIYAMQRDWEALLALELDKDRVASRLGIFNLSRSLNLARAYFLKGEQETASNYAQQHIDDNLHRQLEGNNAEAFRHRTLAEAFAYQGEHSTALKHAQMATALVPVSRDHVFGVNFELTEIWILALNGERDIALERIAAKLDQPEGYHRWELYLAPEWDFFRDDERFNDLVRPAGVEPEPFRQQPKGNGT